MVEDHATCHFTKCREYPYIVVGHAIDSFTLLETSLDDLALAINERHPRVAAKLSRKFPHQSSTKVSFFVNALVLMPPLRTFGDVSGWLNINSIGYMMDEVFELRNAIVHGHLWLDEIHENGFIIEFHRITNMRSNDGKKQLTKQTDRIGSEYIRHQIGAARGLAIFVRSCVDAVNGHNVRRDHDQTMRSHANLREILSFMREVDHPQAEELQGTLANFGVL